MNVSFRGVEKVKQYLASLPRGVKITAMREIATYLIGDGAHGLRHQPARKTHGENNPYQWESEKQRRAYFATDGFGGGIPYVRTGNLASGWEFTEQDSNYTTVSLENSVPNSPFVQGDNLQRGHAADGWRYMMDVINTNIKGAIRKAQAAVDAFIKSKG